MNDHHNMKEITNTMFIHSNKKRVQAKFLAFE